MRVSQLQKLLFSATLSADPEKLEELNLFQPRLYTAVTKASENGETLNNAERGFIGKYTTPVGLQVCLQRTDNAEWTPPDVFVNCAVTCVSNTVSGRLVQKGLWPLVLLTCMLDNRI